MLEVLILLGFSAVNKYKFTLRGVDGGHAYLATREIHENTATRMLGWNRYAHMDVVRHQVAFDDLAFLLSG
jgi:predicted SprT family Zn-dependent metalloprotease